MMSLGWFFRVGWDVFPLHGSASACKDVRFPRIVNQKIYGCGPAGVVDRSWSINGGAVERSAPPLMQVENPMVAGPVEAKLLSSMIASSKAISWHWAGMTNTHLWWLESNHVCRWSDSDAVQCQQAHEPLFLVTSTNSVAWSEPQQIVWIQKGSSEPRRFQVQSIRGLSVSDRRLCWSAWNDVENGVDIFCSDGFHLARTGDQLWPMDVEERLFFREGQTVFEVR